MNKINYIAEEKRVKVGTRNDRADLIFVGYNDKNTPIFVVLEPKNKIDNEIRNENVLTIDQLLKFADPEEWDIDENIYLNKQQ